MRRALLLVLLVPALLPSVLPASDPKTSPPPHWEILDERPAEGEQCLVCRVRVHEGDIVEVRYKGRTFFVSASMLEDFEADPERYFGVLEPHGGLFDEAATETPQMKTGWLYFGLYVLAGLIFGAACAYAALNRRLPALGWFFAGLFANVLALAAILAKKPPSARLSAAAPGLSKIPSTSSPLVCAGCGNTNHPSAETCSSCERTLQPTIEPETARA